MNSIGYKLDLFPIELINHLIGRFNGVIKSNLIKITSTELIIDFKRHQNDNYNILIKLFTKLAESFKIIKTKYVFSEKTRNHIRIRIEETNTRYMIKLIGVSFIPPGKILNLFGLILWYYITYTTGNKSNNSDFGRKLSEEWKIEENMIKREINNRIKYHRPIYENGLCHICGEESIGNNEWKFVIKREKRVIPVVTAVCFDHISKLI
ncbi:MAG: hypothetical protein OEZ01_01640 [Candidatus Heimdallarchaeota archaeon]|nr:hypothetical protein [Candidatus Heimdallarchaeota archaeon]MDH5644676.1 hypothetical protein [Candidatus Heimdallarchaeota archaeon]